MGLKDDIKELADQNLNEGELIEAITALLAKKAIEQSEIMFEEFTATWKELQAKGSTFEEFSLQLISQLAGTLAVRTALDDMR